ncbi:MAG: hypothetical protein GEU26_12500 [Nitrososphaeraceae archaeon]|nr:hypothetical protein [Nitrososphaeraceae archaeon]
MRIRILPRPLKRCSRELLTIIFLCFVLISEPKILALIDGSGSRRTGFTISLILVLCNKRKLGRVASVRHYIQTYLNKEIFISLLEDSLTPRDRRLATLELVPLNTYLEISNGHVNVFVILYCKPADTQLDNEELMICLVYPQLVHSALLQTGIDIDYNCSMPQEPILKLGPLRR